MKLTKIQMSNIRMERICTIMGVGRSTAFQVEVTPSRNIGCIGSIMPPRVAVSTNQDDFDFASEGMGHEIRSLLKY